MNNSIFDHMVSLLAHYSAFCHIAISDLYWGGGGV